jgi:hypothetical protein
LTESSSDATDWKQIVLARVRRATTDLATLGDAPEFQRWREAAAAALAEATNVVNGRVTLRHRPSEWWTGWRVERAWRALHDAEVAIIAADPRLAAHLPAIRVRVALSLPEQDQRRRELEAQDSPAREAVVDAVRAAFDASDDGHAAARALRNKLCVAALALIALNTLLGLVGIFRPGFLPLCVARVNAPGQVACVSGGMTSGASDIWLTQVLGATGALIAAVVSLVRRRPSLSPYIMVGYQALIKVLLGAVLAVVGVLALAAGLGEGLIGLRGQAAVLVAAVVFGYAQQLGTRLLDNYADRLLDQVKPLPRSGD